MKILFQGDSITDANRETMDGFDLYNKGHGYATLVSAELGLDYPNKYEFVNRGISGNKVSDVYARIDRDIISLKPDFISILIGVNDVWHGLDYINFVNVSRFEKIYSVLIEDIKEALPDVKIMLMGPFLLKGTATEENWNAFRSGVEKIAVSAKNVADKFGLPFVPLMEKFDEAAKIAPPEYWTRDGVHPTASGHEIIKREWIKAFKNLDL